ncbi:Beta antigen [Mycobacteroides abscessus subsp. abscessus]|nr:Beta antigen [Mycobacteroides abscessus subsp. abscessus]
MTASIRLMPTKLAAAALAAGVVATGVSIGAADRAVPTVEAKVVPTSLITDALAGAGWIVDGLAGSVAIPIEALVSLPFDALTAIAISVQRPDYAPSVLSWLVNRYANPAESYPHYTFPWDFKANAIGNIAFGLPYPVGPSATQPGLINGIADGIANVIGAALGGLPDPATGVAATDAFWATTPGRILTSLNNVPLAPVWAAWDVVDYVGFLPYNVAATIEAAIKTPQEIPGLLSNLVYGLLGSDTEGGLAGNLIGDLSYPLTTLPGPVGQFATALVANIQQGLDNLLANLPMPVPPALASTAAAKTAVVTGPAPTAAVTGVAAGDVPAVDAASVNTVTLTVSDIPKAPGTTKTPDTATTPDAPKMPDTPKTPEAPTTPADPETPKAPDVPKASDVPKAQDTSKAPETTPDTQGSTTGKSGKKAGKVKSGNKVRPGNKSAETSVATGRPDTSATPASEPGKTDKPAGGAPSGSTGSADVA